MAFPIIGGSQSGGYLIDNSLRFNDDDSASIDKTFSSAGDRRTFTWSSWNKRSGKSGQESIFLGYTATSQLGFSQITFTTSNRLAFTGASYLWLESTQVFRDTSAWYHIVVAVDSTNATADDRVKLYVNGTEITSFNTRNNPSLNDEFAINAATTHNIASRAAFSTDDRLDGYMAEINFIDGQALSPTSFGEFDEDSGIWKPIRYSGSYGTNGFYLDFENSGSLGADQSGNGNNWTPTNLASTDQTTDTPTNNFATLNALDKDGHTNSEGNLKVSGNVIYGMQKATQGVTTGKWYFEARLNVYQNDTAIALSNENENTYTRFTGETTNSVGYLSDGRFFYNGSSTTYSSASGGNILQMAFDADTGKIWVGINNTWQNSGNPSAGTNELQTVSWNTFIPTARTVSTGELIFNFGQEGSFAGTATAQGNTDANGYGDFYYAPPTGFLALCTQNLATALSPTIDDGSLYQNQVLYTGNSGTQSITGVGFQPDLVWIKARNQTYSHRLIDSTRGVDKGLRSSDSSAETTVSGALTSFDSDGFSLGFGTSETNNSAGNYVAWNFKANGGTTSSNTDGTITSTVQANTTAGFSIVTYTAQSDGNDTVGHGLLSAPDIVFWKARTKLEDWLVTSTLFSNPARNFLKLNLTDPVQTFGADAYSITNTTIRASTRLDDTDNYVAYCFHSVEGYSKFGSYEGNNSTDGTFIYTGFAPAFVMVKNIDAAYGWQILDNKRDPHNVRNQSLFANLTNVEDVTTADETDFLSNGFKNREGGNSANDNYTYIYMAFAENPFVTSGAVPVTAR